MSTLELLSELRQLGIQLSTDGGKLRCQAPNNTLTPRLKSALAERKAEIINFLTEGDRGLADVASIPSVSRHQNLPLSFAQQRLWFLDRIEPDSCAYNISEAVQLDGVLDLQVLQRSLDLLVAHHEILRTNYLMADGEPIQVIKSARSIVIQIVDLQQYSTAAQPSQIHIQLHQSSHQPFNLATDLMLRCCLLKLSPTQHILLATMHHIASDAWSMGLFWQQLGRVYTALTTGNPHPLAPLPIQYADYAVWQREWLSSSVLTQQIDYWKQQLTDVNPILELPTDYPRPAMQTYSGAVESIALSPQLTADLQALCRQEGTTLFMTLLAAFQLLMSRHSGQSDFIIAAPIAGRNQTEVEGLIGFFINTLLLDADLSGNPSFQALLGRVRKVALGAYSHQDVPFEKLIEELNPRRDLSRNPLFQVLFNMLNVEHIELDLAGLVATPVSIPEVNSKFDITLYVKEHDRQIQLDLAYNTDLFGSARMVEILHQFEYLLTQIVDRPDRQIQDYSLVTSTARAILPDPQIALPQAIYPPITTTFLDWADRTPSHPAIIQAARTWTYRELATAAQAIAQLLRGHQIEIGDPVAVTGDRSFGLIASMLGVLLSGGVLVNIDPQLPAARQQLIRSAAGTKYLLAIGNNPQIADLSADIQLFNIDPDTGRSTTTSGSTAVASGIMTLPFAQRRLCRIDAAAYIFFTSGTTGVPKGVLGTHQGLAHFLDWQRETFNISPEDRVAQLTGLSFDVVLRDIFLPLTSGATLCLPADTEDLSPGRILPWLERQQITLLHTVPTLAQSWLINVPDGVSLGTLRHIFFAGEPLTATLIHRWRKTFPRAGEIVNLYGPTETTLAKCYYRVPERVLGGIQPVGRPLPATQALVVKLDRQLCGIGEAGEIAIRTPFRTKGYLDPAATDRSRFAQNPDRAEPDDLIYYTGDRGRYRPDGTLEILGRIDRQIKIRGVRVEPTEISALLDKHPQVQTSVVVAREDTPGDKRLVAYCVTQPDTTPTNSELRQLLKQHLPDYLVPSAFVILTALPLTPNGKIDVRALPPPAESRAGSAPSFVAARDEIEVQLTKIWQRVLAVRSISITDNFFELGGHSLLAIRLFAEIDRIWGKNLPLATLLQAQTIEQLADLLRQEGWTAPSCSLVRIQSGSTKPPLFCIHPIGGNVLEYYQLAHYLDLEQPVYGLQSLGLDGKETPLRSIEAMATHYIAEMQIVQPNGPYLLAGYSFAGLVVYEIAQQLDRQGEKVALLALIDRISPTFIPHNPSLIESVSIHLANLWLLGAQDRLTYIIDRIKYRSIYKENFREYMMGKWNNSLSPAYVDVFDANLQASEDYRATAYPGKLTLFRCQIQLQSQAFSADLGWNDLVTKDVEVHSIPTAHHKMLQDPHVKFLSQKLQLCIDRSLTNSNLSID